MTEHRLADSYNLPEWFDSDPELLTYVRCQPDDGEECPSLLVLVGRLGTDGVLTPSNKQGLNHPAINPSHGELWQCTKCDPDGSPKLPELEPWDFEVAQ